MDRLAGILLGLIAGAGVAVTLSAAWGVLLIPTRAQERFQAGSPWLYTWAMAWGLLLAALQNGVKFSLGLPRIMGSAGLLFGGMFVGMMAAALGEILEVAPVLMRRFNLTDASEGIRWGMMIGKGLGAVLGCLCVTM